MDYNVIVNVFFIAETAYVSAIVFWLIIERDMIFGFYGDWLRSEERFNEIVDNYNRINEIPMQKIDIPFWKKPIGLCQTCTLIWIGILFFLLHKYAVDVFTFLSAVSNTIFLFRKLE
jgi:hypothetical protein